MRKVRLVQTAVIGVFVFCFSPAIAQENEGGLRMVFGIDQEFRAGDNLSLDLPEEDTTALSTTTLSFDLISETRTQVFRFGLAGKLRNGRTPDDSNIETGFVEPRATLAYALEGAKARLSFDASYRENDVSFLLPLSTFQDDAGVIVLPPDFEDLRGAGTRQAYSFQTRLETGLNAPFSLILDARVSGVEYKDTTAPSLSDTHRYGLGAETRLRFSEVTTGFVKYNFRHYDAEDLANTQRDTNAVELGIANELSRGGTLEVGIGYTRIEQETNGLTTTDSGATGRLSYIQDMPNGTLSASYKGTRDQNGSRQFLRFGRSMELPLGSLALEVGATRKQSGDPQLIGKLNWQRDLPSGLLGLSLQRDVSTNDEDDERITTTMDFGYFYQINQVSGLNFDAVFGLSENNELANDTLRADFSASYNYELTPDWNLATGVAYRMRDEDTLGKTDSASIFVSLGRDFTIFP